MSRGYLWRDLHVEVEEMFWWLSVGYTEDAWIDAWIRIRERERQKSIDHYANDRINSDYIARRTERCREWRKEQTRIRREQTVSFSCEECGKGNTVPRIKGAKQQRFCDRECFQKNWNRKRREKAAEKRRKTQEQAA